MIITLLKGVVGSTAYGLNTPSSDIDSLGMFTRPTHEFFKLSHPNETIVTKSPDSAMHEAAKYCRLALKCNPTVTELMWLEEYTDATWEGEELVAIRNAFLSERAVRESYLGYAKSQLTRLQDRDHKRATKHAMHMARLVTQGIELYTTGNLTIKVDDPEWFWAFKELDRNAWIEWYNKQEEKFRNSASVLPSDPDYSLIEDWLETVRFNFLPATY